MLLLTNLTLIILICLVVLTTYFKLGSQFLRITTFIVLLQPLLLSYYMHIPVQIDFLNFKFEYFYLLLFPFYVFLFYFFFLVFSCEVNKSFSITLVLMLFTMLSLNTLVGSRDLFIIFFSIEMFTILSFLLLMSGLSDYSFFYSNAVIKYFLFSSLLTSIMFFLVSGIYIEYETTALESLLYYTSFKDSTFKFTLFTGLILFKLGIFPFYFIYVDLYEQLSWRLFYFFNYVSKLFLFAFLIIIYQFFIFGASVTPALFLSLLSVLIGSIGVYNTVRLRRLLIYSSLFNLGISLLLVVCNYPSIGYAYFFVYTILSSFLVINFISFENKDDYIFNRIDDLALVNYALYVIFFSIVLMALSGLPPFSFFWFKLNSFIIFYEFFNVYILLFLIVLSAVITVAYFRIIKYLLYDCGYQLLNYKNSIIGLFFLFGVLTTFNFTYNELILIFNEFNI